MGYSCAVLGASGYTGVELVRLLEGHPALEATALYASKSSGATIDKLAPNLEGVTDLPVEALDGARIEADVCFSCLPSGRLPELIGSVEATLVVDLSDSYRADPGWVYGLPELNRTAIAGADRIANPGCYPTAALLAVAPFARANMIDGPVVVDGLSGLSGAGRGLEDRLLFANASGAAGAYGDTRHRHVPEMERGLEHFGGKQLTVSFTPHLIPIPRGLVITAHASLASDIDDAAATEVLRAAYRDEPFVSVVSAWPSTKAVAGTNRAHVTAQVDARARTLVCSAAIDNLGKGAASQAIQNVNIALGLDEAAGLGAVAVWP